MKQITAADTARLNKITAEMDNEYVGLYHDKLAGETMMDETTANRILRLKHLRSKIELRYTENMVDTMAVIAGSALV